MLSHFAVQSKEKVLPLAVWVVIILLLIIAILLSAYYELNIVWDTCFTGADFGMSSENAIIVLVLQMRKLRPERLRNLPKGTQLVGRRSRSRLRKFGFSALVATGHWVKSEVLDACILQSVLSSNCVRGGCDLLTLLFLLWPAQWFAYNFSSVWIS